MSNKERIDILLVKKGFFTSRERAKASIMAAEVYVDGKRINKAGELVPLESKIEIKGKKIPYVSRGGLKLEKAVKLFNLNLKNKIAMDVGASTGGFTDCLLQNGVIKVYSIDVGYGQLDWRLRNDPRVINMERTNIRYLDKIEDKIDIVTIDVSFISLSIVIPVIVKFIKNEGELVALIKPEFEAGRDKVGKKGVVKDADVHKDVIKKIIKILKDNMFCIKGLTFSPITGPEGNIEYLVYTIYNINDSLCNDDNIIVDDIVEESHKELLKK